METAHVFGRLDNLVGICQAPLTEQNAATAVIMLTPGMLHHAGPFRLHVRLAESLAAARIPSFRFDLSGIGESLAVGSAGTSLDRAAQETRHAMDLMQREYGIERFVLFGICSGADDSFHAALHDQRVCGAVLMDGCGYRTRRFYFNRLGGYYLRRLTSAAKWRSYFAKKSASWNTSSTLRMGDDIREFPDRDQAARQLQQLVDRGVKLRFLYTGGAADYYNYASQFADMFANVQFRDRVTWKYFSEMDHVAFLCEDRASIVADVVSWVRESFAAGNVR